MLIIIDNYDSFTYNIVQTLATAPANAAANWQPPEVMVVRNDAVTVDDIMALAPKRLLISPGPRTPKEAGISMAAILAFSERIPVLGVCLGHQSIGEVFGGRVIRASRLMHGKTSPIHHDGLGVFSGLPSPFDGMRYHSLVVEEQTLPDCLLATAHTDQGELMGLRHRSLPIEGVQFHPESIMTTPGSILLHTFLRLDYEQLLRDRS
ncbi:glutamine amidotransferase-related protein [Desulfobulbus alkaliphilus]|uniref:glutamine amidotransferase-related protein n=1 Tax=Desulfobulbus alkaliphilus TaxID=869814 RepID=UPI001965C375|nr:aminodeoxychorismate/anthranilate synthase component II [Desulfobulbus alkaliphilus]